VRCRFLQCLPGSRIGALKTFTFTARTLAGFEHEHERRTPNAERRTPNAKRLVRPNRDSGLLCAGAIVQIQAIMIQKDL
jgi:hypothetical protein